MNKMCLILLSAVTLLFSGLAEASTLSIVGVGDSNTFTTGSLPSGTTTPTVSGKFSFGGGALLTMPIGPRVGLEVGALYITRKNEANPALGSSQDITNTSHAIQVPVLLKFHLFPAFHVGVGGYWAQGIGSVDSNNATTGVDNSSQTYSGANLKQTDYGLVGAAGFSFPLGGGTRLLAEGRYNYGLANIFTDPNSTGATEKYRDLQAVVGLSFALGHGR